jgi:hypothetical protein
MVLSSDEYADYYLINYKNKGIAMVSKKNLKLLFFMCVSSRSIIGNEILDCNSSECNPKLCVKLGVCGNSSPLPGQFNYDPSPEHFNSCPQGGIRMRANVAPGNRSYIYDWDVMGLKGNAQDFLFTPFKFTGPYTGRLTVIDKNNKKCRLEISFSGFVFGPTVTITPAKAVISEGQSQTFVAEVTPQAKDYSYKWTLLGYGLVGDQATITVDKPGTYIVQVIDNNPQVGQCTQSNDAEALLAVIPSEESGSKA